jgi:hypothetical protein
MTLGGEDALPALLSKLRQVAAKEMQAKRDYIRKVKPLFSYYSPEFKESLMHALSLRVVDQAAITTPSSSFNFDIDFVYTWVNGTDPEWLASKRGAPKDLEAGSVRDDSTMDTRFRDREELRFSFRSRKKNAPWVRKVHIVVAGNQSPALANHEDQMLNIVRHEDIFPLHHQAAALPTFNNFAIESVVDQISGLSEKRDTQRLPFKMIGSPTVALAAVIWLELQRSTATSMPP